MKMGLERRLRERIPEIVDVVQDLGEVRHLHSLVDFRANCHALLGDSSPMISRPCLLSDAVSTCLLAGRA